MTKRKENNPKQLPVSYLILHDDDNFFLPVINVTDYTGQLITICGKPQETLSNAQAQMSFMDEWSYEIINYYRTPTGYLRRYMEFPETPSKLVRESECIYTLKI